MSSENLKTGLIIRLTQILCHKNDIKKITDLEGLGSTPECIKFEKIDAIMPQNSFRSVKNFGAA
jgi:hypothetical protein